MLCQEDVTKNLQANASLALLTSLLLLALPACGGSTSRQLLSVTISPGTASAPNASNGQVQYVATGHYNMAPYEVTPLQATWGVSSFPVKVASITQNGMATCNQGLPSTVAVEDWVQVEPSTCALIDSAGRPGCGNVGGSAQLTCP